MLDWWSLILNMIMFAFWIIGGVMIYRGKMEVGFWTDNKWKRRYFGIVLIIAALLGVFDELNSQGLVQPLLDMVK